MSVVGILLKLLQELNRANVGDIEVQRMRAGKGWDVRCE